MKKKIIIGIWILFVSGILLFAGSIYAIEKGWVGYMPPLTELSNPIDRYATQVFSDDGKLLGTWSKNENRIFAPKDSISPYVLEALVATEDVRFYEHSGIDFRSLLRAIIKRGLLQQKKAGGGSTITQQLAKQLYSKVAPNSFQRMLQKPIEWAIAVEIEKFYTKDEIITLYLNYFDFLHNAVGITTAAKVYFDKSPKKLSLLESATLVGMCKNPAYYNPMRYKERTRGRRNVVLQQMAKAGYISEATAKELSKKPLELRFSSIDHKDGLAPYLREFLRRVMMAKEPKKSDYNKWHQDEYHQDSIEWEENPLYGWCNKNVNKEGRHYNIYTDGLRVYTSIDSRMQKIAEDAMYSYVGLILQKQFDKEKKNSKTYPFYYRTPKSVMRSTLNRAMKQSERYRWMKENGYSEAKIKKVFARKTPMRVFTYQGRKDTVMTPMDSIKYYKGFLHSALVSIEPQTGFVRSYVGGMNYRNFQFDMATMGRRQVGSTIKPFVYSLALEAGYSPYFELPNEQRTYQGKWTPRDGGRSHIGEMMPLKWGLSHSNNWITAGIMDLVDPTGEKLKSMLERSGVKGNDVYPSIALCLGSCGITVEEMASAYTSFVNKGMRCAPLLVSRIEDSKGNVLTKFSPRMDEVMSEKTSYKILSILKDVIDEGTGVRLRYRYKIKGDLAGKTGTTNNNSDGWFVGITPRLVTACWVGGEDPTIHFNSMAYGQGAASALPVFATYLQNLYEVRSLGYSPTEKFEIPAEVLMEDQMQLAADSLAQNQDSRANDLLNQIFGD